MRFLLVEPVAPGKGSLHSTRPTSQPAVSAVTILPELTAKCQGCGTLHAQVLSATPLAAASSTLHATARLIQLLPPFHLRSLDFRAFFSQSSSALRTSRSPSPTG